MGKRIEKIVSGIFIHHNAPSLDILYLNMEGKISKLYSWISFAIAKNIKPLDLQTSYTESIEVISKLCYLQVMIRGEVYLSRLHTLVLSCVTFGGEEIICCQWNNILYLLESLVNLEVLILQKDYEDDLQLIKYFLQNGEVLEKIDLYVANNLNTKAPLEMVKKISMFCRLSPTCEVHFLKRNSGSCKKLMIRPLNVIPFDC
ncbi:hypothetical protein M9H77_00221 [Catharanthus roseus]|nr:hypothetical protein M9H77_00221 [Catharanthus roseus]